MLALLRWCCGAQSLPTGAAVPPWCLEAIMRAVCIPLRGCEWWHLLTRWLAAQTPASIQSQVENTISNSLSPNQKHWIKIAIIIGIVVAALCLLSLVCCLVRCICWPCCCIARSIK